MVTPLAPFPFSFSNIMEFRKKYKDSVLKKHDVKVRVLSLRGSVTFSCLSAPDLPSVPDLALNYPPHLLPPRSLVSCPPSSRRARRP